MRLETVKKNDDKLEFSISQEELDKKWADAKASMHGHSWIQQGTQISCESCPFPHSFYIEPGYILKGIDDNGNPIIDTTLTQQ